jgi:superfamily II RNA helicase
MDWPLYWRLPPKTEVNNDTLLDRFLDFVASKNLQLYPAQEEAILELLEGKNLILNTPTGSGKSLVALALHFQSLALGRRSIYTCPIKALVNEKFRDLCAAFGPDQVGMITGDGGVNQGAPIICCTAEILSNMALRDGKLAPVDDIIMDEFHYYSDRQRGVAWQIPMLILSKARFMLMSATLGDMAFFSKALTALNQKPTSIVSSQDRPVPLDFEYRETPLHETISEYVSKGLYPIYLVNFSQREAAEEAQNLLSVDFATKEEKQSLKLAIEGIKFQSPYGKEIQKLLRHGVGLHHAGLLPKYRVLVERLAQQGLLKVISGTDTLGVGVNVPIRTVLFTKLCKYDGEKTTLLNVRDFQQISGRAGRRGFDSRGLVAVQAPEHVIENLRMKLKAASDPKKAKKLVLKNPPPHGFIMWNKDGFNKLINSQPEPLQSRFLVSHSMLLNVLSRDEDGCQAMQKLIHDSHGTFVHKRKLRKTGFEYFRSLLDRQIIEFIPSGPRRRKIRVNVDLQEDFSLNHSLSLYLLDTVKLLDPQDPNYALDLLTLVESILESPDLILRRQLDRLKTQKMAEMKMAGIEFDERIAELEKLEPPKPNREFIYSTFNAFSAAHPWVGEENIRPKSVAREMVETFQSFHEYVREYDLQRIEGLLLRYLTEVFKVLEQTIPDAAKNDEVRALAVYFGTMVRQTDSSLIDDWEKMRTPLSTPEAEKAAHVKTLTQEGLEPDITRDTKAFTLIVRNEVHRLVRALASRDFEAFFTMIAPEKISADEVWTADELDRILKVYLEDHQKICTDPAARNPLNTRIEFKDQRLDKPQKADQGQTPGVGQYWLIEQTLVDPDGHNDWTLTLQLDLEKCKKEHGLVINLVSLNPTGII